MKRLEKMNSFSKCFKAVLQSREVPTGAVYFLTLDTHSYTTREKENPTPQIL